MLAMICKKSLIEVELKVRNVIISLFKIEKIEATIGPN